MRNELFKRCPENPIITSDDCPFSGVIRVFNPAAAEFGGKTVLLVRCKDQKGGSHLALVESENGLTDWDFQDKPTLQAEERYGEYVPFGLEDSRIVWVEELEMFVISCVSARTCFMKNPHGICLIGTRDFRSFFRISEPLSLVDKDACLLPERINNKWALIHRPIINEETCIAVSFSPSSDLKYFGETKQILSPVPGTWCDSHVGLATQPIKTEHGWLIIFHGSEEIASKMVYYVGLALLDLKTLDVTHRRKQWAFGPKEDYEGGLGGIVFPCGAILKGDDLKMYYGADDSTVCLAVASLKEILDDLMKCPEK